MKLISPGPQHVPALYSAIADALGGSEFEDVGALLRKTQGGTEVVVRQTAYLLRQPGVEDILLPQWRDVFAKSSLLEETSNSRKHRVTASPASAKIGIFDGLLAAGGMEFLSVLLKAREACDMPSMKPLSFSARPVLRWVPEGVCDWLLFQCFQGIYDGDVWTPLPPQNHSWVSALVPLKLEAVLRAGKTSVEVEEPASQAVREFRFQIWRQPPLSFHELPGEMLVYCVAEGMGVDFIASMAAKRSAVVSRIGQDLVICTAPGDDLSLRKEWGRYLKFLYGGYMTEGAEDVNGGADATVRIHSPLMGIFNSSDNAIPEEVSPAIDHIRKITDTMKAMTSSGSVPGMDAGHALGTPDALPIVGTTPMHWTPEEVNALGLAGTSPGFSSGIPTESTLPYAAVQDTSAHIAPNGAHVIVRRSDKKAD